jgi:hypothetical protein
MNSVGEVVWSEQQKIAVAPYGEKNYPVVLDLPWEPGGYTLVTEFDGALNPVRPQISRRYINLGSRTNQYFTPEP